MNSQNYGAGRGGGSQQTTPRRNSMGVAPPPPPANPAGASGSYYGTEGAGNDCELLLFGKEQLKYAEEVEKRLRKMGFKVDMMFLKPETKLAAVLAGLTSMRTMFGVTIQPQHEFNRSLTIHVIATPPGAPIQRLHECHKNMGLEDAYIWLKTQAAKFKLEEFKVIPDSAKRQMKGLLDSRFMSDSEYQGLVDFMHDRWIAQRSLQGKLVFDEGTGISTTDELRKRILNVLGVDEQALDQVPVQASVLPAGINDNPQVQEAVDTLMRSALNPFGLTHNANPNSNF